MRNSFILLNTFDVKSNLCVIRQCCVKLGVVVLLTLTTACSAVMQTASQVVVESQTIVPDQWQETTSEGAEENLLQWWTQFQDPVLTDLIKQALDSNNDIAVAQGRLRSARASYDAASGARWPSVSIGADALRQKSLKGPAVDNKNYSMGLDATWELDLVGKLRNTAAAAALSLQSSEASLYDVQRVIAADVALNYISLRDAQARLDVAEKNLSIQLENLQIAQWRNEAGQGDALEVEQARTVVAQTRAVIPQLRQSIATFLHQLDVLLASAPGSHAALLMKAAGTLPKPPELAGIGLPAELLSRRPDVLSAQHALEAEVIRIGVAEADLYPAMRLSGGLNTSSDRVGDLFDVSLGSLMGGITAPIFQGGQIRARIEQQKGSADVALANYQKSILVALQDVENALVASRSAREREAALNDAEIAALASVQLAEIRYRSGAIDFQTLLDAQRNLLSVQDSRVSASSSRSTAAVQLFKALGGGWHVASTTAEKFLTQ